MSKMERTFLTVDFRGVVELPGVFGLAGTSILARLFGVVKIAGVSGEPVGLSAIPPVIAVDFRGETKENSIDFFTGEPSMFSGGDNSRFRKLPSCLRGDGFTNVSEFI